MDESKLWSIDHSCNSLRHKNGTVVTFEKGVVMNIDSVPSSLDSTEIRNLMRSARRVYSNIKRTAEKTENVPYKPSRPVLSLNRE